MLWISNRKRDEYAEYFVSIMRTSLLWAGKSRSEITNDLLKIGFKETPCDRSGILYFDTNYQTIELTLDPSVDMTKVEHLTFSGAAEIKNLTVVCSGFDEATADQVIFDCYILPNPVHKTPYLARQIERKILSHPALMMHQALGISYLTFKKRT